MFGRRITMKAFLKVLALFMAVLTVLALASCSKSNDAMEDVESSIANPSVGTDGTEIERKITYRVNMRIESDEVSKVSRDLTQKCKDLEGYVEYKNEQYNSSGSSSARITFRIPTENLDEFVSFVEENGELKRKNESISDVTGANASLESKLSSLKDKKQVLEKMLEEEKLSVNEKLNLIDQISSIDSQIEYFEGLLAGNESVVEYSVVTVNVQKPVNYVMIVVTVVLVALGITAVTLTAVLVPLSVSKKRRQKMLIENS